MMKQGFVAKTQRALGLKLGWIGRAMVIEGIGPLAPDNKLCDHILDSDRAWSWLHNEIENQEGKSTC